MDNLEKRYLPHAARVMKEMNQKDEDLYLMQICTNICLNNYSNLVSNDENTCLGNCFYKALEFNQHIDSSRRYFRPDTH